MLPLRSWPPRWALALAFVAGCDTRTPPSPPAAPPPGAVAPSAGALVAPSLPPPLVSASAALPATALPAPEPPIVLASGGKRAVRGDAGLVTSVEEAATHAAAEVLRAGGNAIDAAVALAFALSVTHPSAGNIGGGGFMIVRLAAGETYAVDFRETSPASVTTASNMAMIRAGAHGYASAGVPGSVAGLALALERSGTRPLAELLAPAIALARDGHRIGARQALTLRWAWPKLKADPAARAIWGRGGAPFAEGDRVRQLDLARTLEALAAGGPRAFYEGAVAKKIAAAMREHSGQITEADLRGYQAKVRAPLRFSYRGFTVDTMPPPSMGGVAFAEIMLTLERLRAHEAPVDSGLWLHLFAEAAKRAYAERRLVGADPDFAPPDVAGLLARQLAGDASMRRAAAIDPEHATPAAEVAPAQGAAVAESPQTTHFSVIDAWGNAVSCTTTQSGSFGSKVVIPGTGVLLNNTMGAFSETGVNAVAPGKRMSSSMTPTVVSRDGKVVLILGSPGGDTIPNTVAQVLRNVVDGGMSIDEAVDHGRIHHQGAPDKVRVERRIPPPKAALDDLIRRGHGVAFDRMPIGAANNLLVDAAGVAWGYADPREGGKVEGVRVGSSRGAPTVTAASAGATPAAVAPGAPTSR